MAVKVSTITTLNPKYEDIINYIDEKVQDIKSLIQDAIDKASYTEDKYNAILGLVGQINNKVPEDVVDRLNSLGTLEDFVQGLNDGLGT